MKFAFWENYPQGWREESNLGCFTQCHQLVGQISHITIIRCVAPWIILISLLHCKLIEQADSWINLRQILPLIRKHKVLHLNRTDARLANNGLPVEIQKLRCRVNYASLRFTSQIEELGKRVIRILRHNGPFLVLHLRYEMDMLAFSGCTQGCSKEEAEELTRMRSEFSNYNYISQELISQTHQYLGFIVTKPSSIFVYYTTPPILWGIVSHYSWSHMSNGKYIRFLISSFIDDIWDYQYKIWYEYNGGFVKQ